jgi:NADP-dependent 3-hydroxy acid dehydrogenase YdfG
MATAETLKGKVALITGASRGIGFAVARKLGQMGARLSLCARGATTLEKAAKEIQGQGASAVAIPADVTRASDIASLIQKTKQTLGPIEILVNNAGVGYFAPIQQAEDANWDAVLDTNLKAVFLLSKAVAPGMI